MPEYMVIRSCTSGSAATFFDQYSEADNFVFDLIEDLDLTYLNNIQMYKYVQGRYVFIREVKVI